MAQPTASFLREPAPGSLSMPRTHLVHAQVPVLGCLQQWSESLPVCAVQGGLRVWEQVWEVQCESLARVPSEVATPASSQGGREPQGRKDGG